ncbi:MAG: ribosome small subunit-dependent GTPase A [Eubacteriales bacterium]
MVSEEGSDSNTIIHQVLTRKSVFLRTAVGMSGQAQSVAANIDTIFICMSLNNNFNLSRLERYLSVAWDSGATPVILLTKADLCDDLDKKVYEAECASSFADVIALSIFDENLDEKFVKYLKLGTTSAFIGSSGVGKSTLINRILGEDILPIADTGKLDKGKHTTTGRAMFISPFGGVVIDTPGMRELGVESANFTKTFNEIEEMISQCKFHDCTHTNEPDCAILAAIASGRLDERRFANYQKLKVEARYDGLNAKEIEVKKLDRMFKEVGGMKNMRKFAKEQRKRKS